MFFEFAEVRKKAKHSVSHPLLLLFGLGEQFADVSLGLSDVLVEDLRAVDDLWFTGIEHLADLPGHECFTTARRPKEQDALHVLAACSGGAAPGEKKKRPGRSG